MRRAAVLGSPIAHSLSPVLHRAAYASLGLTDITYDRVEVTADELPAFMAGLDETWIGLSLTMPLKVAILDLVTSQSEAVQRTHVANTVVMTPDGPRVDNTDIHGLAQALAGASADLTDVVIVGTGATARSALAAVADADAATVTVLARRPEAVEQIQALALGVDVAGLLTADPIAGERVSAASLVISTVPASAHAALLANVRITEPVGQVLDVAYEPWPTALMQCWPASSWISGLEMLLAQAVPQVEQMTGTPCGPDVVAAMRQALAAAAPPGALTA